jgi:hypothetical protein
MRKIKRRVIVERGIREQRHRLVAGIRDRTNRMEQVLPPSLRRNVARWISHPKIGLQSSRAGFGDDFAMSVVTEAISEYSIEASDRLQPTNRKLANLCPGSLRIGSMSTQMVRSDRWACT